MCKTKSKFLSLMIAAFVVTFMLLTLSIISTETIYANSDSGSGQPVVASGVCGDIDWVIYNDGLMVLSGDGEFDSTWIGTFAFDKDGNEHFLPSVKPNWTEYNERIKNVKVQVNGCTNMTALFSGYTYPNLESVDFTGSDTSKVKSFIGLFSGNQNLKYVNMSNLDFSSLCSTSWMFTNCGSLKEIDLTGSSTFGVTAADYMFSGCTALESFEDIENLDFTNMLDLNSIFYACPQIKELDLSGWGCQKVQSTRAMFWDCKGLVKLNLAGWNVENVTNADYMFHWCENLESLDLTNWNFKNLGSANQMFSCCTKLKAVDTTGWSFENLVDSYYMFGWCYGLDKLAIPGGLKTMGEGMLYACTGIKDLQIPDSVTEIRTNAVSCCSNLKNVQYAGTKAQWNGIAVDNSNELKSTLITTSDSAPAPEDSGVATPTPTPTPDPTPTPTPDPAPTPEPEQYEVGKVTLSAATYVYNGKVKSPKVIVKDSKGNVLKKNVAYTVTTPKGRKAIGKYTYTINFKGDFAGTKAKKLTLTIKPKAPTITAPKGAKKAVTVKWKKGKKVQVTGYQVMVATNSKFTKNAKTVTVKGYSKTSKKVTKLKAKTKYFVKVRTYKTVKGVKIYSNWSTVKSIKAK